MADHNKPALSVLTLRRVANELRQRAANPVPTSLSKAHVDGVCDGMRLSADVIDALCDAAGSEAYPSSAPNGENAGYASTGGDHGE